jgi:hypothetical protein
MVFDHGTSIFEVPFGAARRRQSSRRFFGAAMAAAVALAPVLGLPAAAEAASHVKPGIYDCWSAATGMFEYLESYQFKANGQYGLGSRLHGNKLTGKVDWGRYTTKGSKVIGLSGELKRDHYYLVTAKKGDELVVYHSNGKPTGIGCYRYKG